MDTRREEKSDRPKSLALSSSVRGAAGKAGARVSGGTRDDAGW